MNDATRIKLYVLSDPAINATGIDVPVVAWEAICHDRSPKLIIHFEAVRWLSRWMTVPRKRPFCVHSVRRGRWSTTLSYHATLAAAIRAAKQSIRYRGGEG